MATNSSSLAWRIPWTEEPSRLHTPWGCKESDTTEQLTFNCVYIYLSHYVCVQRIYVYVLYTYIVCVCVYIYIYTYIYLIVECSLIMLLVLDM